MALRKVSGVREETAQREHGKAPGYLFAIGTSKRAPKTLNWLSEKDYRKAAKLQSSETISVGTITGGRYEGKTLWWCRDEFYVDKRPAAGAVREEGLAGLVPIVHVDEVSEGGWLAGSARRHRFVIRYAGFEDTTSPWLANTEYVKAKRLRWSRPVSVGTIVAGPKSGRVVFVGLHRNKTMWWYKDEFYVEKDYYRSDPRKGGLTGLTKVTGVHEDIKNRDPVYAKHYRFAVGTSRDAPSTTPWLHNKEYRKAKRRQASEPVSVGTLQGGSQEGKTLWWYKDEFYAEDDGYTSEEVALLLWEREQKKTATFERLRKEMLSERELDKARRERIPEDVRIFVWKRDEGKCVECGSQENLEYDHIIPVAKGGSNTARNIQLLCETCNRRKSDNI